MLISSISFFRHPTATSLPSLSAPLFRHVSSRLRLSANLNLPPRKPDKNLLKAKDSIKDLSSLNRDSPIQSRPSLQPSQAIGLVAAAQANFMRVFVEDSAAGNPVGVELLCVVRALLKKIRRRVLVGDKVLVGSVDWIDRRGMIEDVFQRKTEVVDPPVANVDRLVVLFSMEQPKLEPFLLTRFLVEAESTEIPFTLALNKAELVEEQILLDWKSRLRAWGYEPLFCSVDSKYGLDTLATTLKEQTTVIVGPSGVGKSSLINALRSNQPISDDWLEHSEARKWFEDQRVGEVSTKSGRGKHTTRHVSLLPLAEGGYLADTPGFNQPSLMKVTKKNLAQMFPEALPSLWSALVMQCSELPPGMSFWLDGQMVRRMLHASEPAKCSFNDCLHLGEPGCLVKADWERYPYYLQLLDEIKIREEFQLRTFGTKRESDVRFKVRDMGAKQAEPRLERKKHRRPSRKELNQSILDELDELDEADDLLDIEEGTR